MRISTFSFCQDKEKSFLCSIASSSTWTFRWVPGDLFTVDGIRLVVPHNAAIYCHTTFSAPSLKLYQNTQWNLEKFRNVQEKTQICTSEKVTYSRLLLHGHLPVWLQTCAASSFSHLHDFPSSTFMAIGLGVENISEQVPLWHDR